MPCFVVKMKKLNPKIVEELANKLHCTKNSVQARISMARSKNPDFSRATSNAIGQLIAQQNNHTVWRLLDEEDRASIPQVKFKQVKREIKMVKRSLPTFVNFDTKDPFLSKHLVEINNTYNANCCTATYILLRKVFENLLVQTLKERYPPNIPQNKELYWEAGQGRHKDFSDVLDSFNSKINDFGTEKAAARRLHQKLFPFKKDANDFTHSLFHIANKKEIDDAEPQVIFDLFAKLSNKPIPKPSN